MSAASASKLALSITNTLTRRERARTLCSSRSYSRIIPQGEKRTTHYYLKISYNVSTLNDSIEVRFILYQTFGILSISLQIAPVIAESLTDFQHTVFDNILYHTWGVYGLLPFQVGTLLYNVNANIKLNKSVSWIWICAPLSSSISLPNIGYIFGNLEYLHVWMTNYCVCIMHVNTT